MAACPGRRAWSGKAPSGSRVISVAWSPAGGHEPAENASQRGRRPSCLLAGLQQLGGEGGIRTPGRGFNPLQQISNLPCSATPAPLREVARRVRRDGQQPCRPREREWHDEDSTRPGRGGAGEVPRGEGGGGRGTRTPKGREARELSRLLPYQL